MKRKLVPHQHFSLFNPLISILEEECLLNFSIVCLPLHKYPTRLVIKHLLS